MDTQPYAAISAPNPGAPAQATARTVSKAIAVLVLAGLLAYGNSLTRPYHMDDSWLTDSVREDKPTDTAHPKGYPRIEDLWAFVKMQRNRPVAALTFHLNYRIHEFGVFGFHVVNLAIHIAAALTLFGLVRRTLLLPRWQGRFNASATWLGLVTALFWMVHPLQTQAVTYIIQRYESMMGLCYLLTFYCLVRGAESTHSWRWYLAGWLSCLIGAGSKEVMMTILPILYCYDWMFVSCPQDRPRRGWNFWANVAALKAFLRNRLYFYEGIAVICFVSAMPSVQQKVITDTSAGFGIDTLSAREHWMTQTWVLLYYCRLCIIPYPQYFWYRDLWPATREMSECWPALAALGVIAFLTLGLMWRRNWIGFLSVWFFGILSITSVVPLRDEVFEHRLYLSLAAVSCLVVIGGYLVLQRLLKTARRTAIAGGVCAFLIGGTLLALTLKRNEDYRSNAAIWASWQELSQCTCDSLHMLYICVWWPEKP